MGKILTVPTVAQTSSYTCWHAAAMMIWAHWQHSTSMQGPMNTVSEAWGNNKPIEPPEWVTLAEKVGLKKVAGPIDYLTEQNLEELLTQHGPLWCAGRWYGTGHAIVLTGVSRDVIFFNDPDHGRKKTQSIRWFNEKLFKEVDGCLMYKDPARY